MAQPPLDPSADHDEPQDDDILAEGEQAENDDDTVKKAVPAWIISIVMHAVILGALALIVVASKIEKDEPAVQITQLPPPPPEEKPKPERDIKDTEVQLEVEVESEKPSPVSELDVPVEEFSQEEEVESEVPKGREEATADAEMGGSGAFMAIGAGGGSAGMFGSRSGGGKKRALGKFGGSRASESAVDAALRWFKRHQSPNGQWDTVGYPANCPENPKCEPGGLNHTSTEESNAAATGYALLCFLGAGYDHRMPSKYRSTVKAGVDWLVSSQQPDGTWSSRNYGNAVAAMALAEAYAMSNDPGLRGPAQRAIDLLVSRQIKDTKGGGYGLGWDYTTSASRNDSSLTGWVVMALKSAAGGGLNVGNAMEGSKAWFEGAWRSCNPDPKTLDPYTGISDFPYTWDSLTNDYKHNFSNKDLNRNAGRNCAPMGALCAVFLGYKQGDIMLETLANHVSKHMTPKGYPTNTYYMYYNTLAIFQVGGERWTKWNDTVRDMIVTAQRKEEGCFDGSWDFKGTEFPGHEGGRIFSTAFCCLSLEVYYRYLPVGAGKK